MARLSSPLLLLLLSALSFLAGPLAAQVLTPTKLTASLSQPSAAVGTELDLIVQARIQPGWHLYATDFNPNVGPAVFTLTFTKSPAYVLVGPPKSVKSKHAHDETFDGEVAYFTQTGQIRQRIRVLKPGPLIINAEAEYQSCSDADGRCVPGDASLSFGPFTVTAKAAAAPAALPAKPKAARPTSSLWRPVVLPSPVAPNFAPEQPPVAAPITLVAGPRAAAPVASVAAATILPPSPGLWQFGLLAFFSGLAALLTPCVFPMVPMTVSFFTSGQDSRRRSIVKALVYGLSIILIYTIIGVIVARVLGEDGPNFLATHWVPNLLFFVVFVVFGLSFLGLFDITLPHQLVNRADRQADKGGWVGVFFMAFTLVLVSFSCTGPIVATILSLSVRGETLLPVIGMLGFSLAFALPFTLFAIFPSWLKSLPRSGGWLNTVKVTLGLVELMLALKFLSTVDLTYHWGLLDRDVYLTIWIALSIMLGLYLLGKIKLSHDCDLTHLSVGRVLMATLTFGFTVYLVPGLFGAPLPLLAGYLPPQTEQLFSLKAPQRPAPATAATQLPTETPRFADLLHLPHGLSGYFDLEQARRVARQQHKPIFIDFTGHGCVNCRKMEATVWSNPQVLQKLRNDYVVVALYVDDKTTLPEAEWYTSKRDNKPKTTLGKQNADLQLTRYGVNAQPYYVLLDPEDSSYQPLVASVAYEPDAARFAEFLTAGVQRYQAAAAPLAVR
ncbi:cytochrome c biogenesis protein transmembrane region [Hymenobacter roseosalivarius DSM 11622]|uniref:Cytochrome c biogenesis protein transmembrane region n=1 Tax=Hymenobacter roseosalivarius DSM 11622 TaxID=645990 RepID=A0A1W1W213_9BACT|nr:cytochrome c biogenesis protein CcdA [Hymenobacter roseosalivarius]SMB99431.1 cytochrome c biogenesis protein transmembrane region [Hymenobacter roseosalivarius DSM 11622]